MTQRPNDEETRVALRRVLFGGVGSGDPVPPGPQRGGGDGGPG